MGRRRGASYRPDYSSREDESPLVGAREQKTSEHLAESHKRHNNRQPRVETQESFGERVLQDQDHAMPATRFSSFTVNTVAAPDPYSLPWRTHVAPANGTQHPSDFRSTRSWRDPCQTGARTAAIDQTHRPQNQGQQRQRGYFRTSRIQQSQLQQSSRSTKNVQKEPFRPTWPSQRSFGTNAISNHTLPLQVSSRASYSLRPRPLQQAADHNQFASSLIRPSIETENPLNKSPRRKKRPTPDGRNDRTSSPIVDPPPCPVPSPEYIYNAQQSQERRSTVQKLLVILDLNGTLLVRPDRKHPTKFTPRPGVNLLLEYLFNNHIVMIYSSARPTNVQAMLQTLLHPNQSKMLAAVWSRDKLGLTKAQYNAKVQVYKNLESVWADPTINKGRKWDQSNTVLVDDNIAKGAAQPHNLVHIPEFVKPAANLTGAARSKWHKDEQAILLSLQEKLDELKWQVDVSRLIREWHVGAEKAPGVVDESSAQDGELVIKIPSEHESTSATSTSSSGGDDSDNGGSVSPINEKIFQDLLGTATASDFTNKT